MGDPRRIHGDDLHYFFAFRANFIFIFLLATTTTASEWALQRFHTVQGNTTNDQHKHINGQ
jgi:hypothetical protein